MTSYPSSKEVAASPKLVREVSPYLLTLLHGTTQNSSPLSRLRGHEHLLRIIWEIVCEEWMYLHIEHFPVDLTMNRIPELLPLRRGPYEEYPQSRQNVAGCPVAVLEVDIRFPRRTTVPPNTFKNQQSSDLYVNMMPFNLLEERSLPVCCRQYWPMIQKCTRMLDFEEGGPNAKYGYLTIDERPVPTGTSQRRPGLHVESPGVMPLIQSVSNPKTAQYAIQTASGTYVPGAEHHWGGGLMMRREYVQGGIFMASNIADTTAVWNCTINDEDGEFIGAHGDIERFRDLLGPCARTLDAGELIWMTDRTPHESLPIPAASAGTRRQYFRLVVGQVSAWFADHSTSNPLGTKHPSDVRIVYGDKFKLYPTPTRGWHCGTPQQIRSAKESQVLRQRMCMFGMGHLVKRLREYGITTPSELIRVYKLQGGLPDNGRVDFGAQHSKDKKTELFDIRGSYFYDRDQFNKMVCSFSKLMATVAVW